WRGNGCVRTGAIAAGQADKRQNLLQCCSTSNHVTRIGGQRSRQPDRRPPPFIYSTYSSMAFSTSVDLKIPFFDVDSMRIAWHGHYAKYFEIARCALLDRIGHNFDEEYASGHSWPIDDMRTRVVRPLRFGALVRVPATHQ